jgi:hypothetical protein
LPVLEALHCGAPVVTSNCSSLPEYAGSHSWLCDPTSPQAMAQVLQQALAEPREARRRKRQEFAEEFSWHKTAERACDVMERLPKARAHPVRRRRLAWVMPLTKNTHRMADYTAELLALLAKRFDIELITASVSRNVPKTLLRRRHLILTAQEVPARHAALPYDMFIYQSGLPPMSQEMLQLSRWFPGLVLRHDCPTKDPRRLAAKLAAWIDRAILHHEQSKKWCQFIFRVREKGSSRFRVGDFYSFGRLQVKIFSSRYSSSRRKNWCQ